MSEQVSKPFFKGTRGKVIAAFLLAFTGIALALSITYFSFYELMGTVDELSEPNKKLRSLNELFRKITSLDQRQRTELVRNYKYPSDKLLNSNKDLFLILDTLKMMSWESEEQLERVYAMQEILRERDRLFVNYLHLRYEDAKNQRFLIQLDSLSEVLSQHTVPLDTTIVTTQNQKTITSYVPVKEEKDERSFFKKLFKKKKSDDAGEVIKVREEVSFITDTIPLTRKDSAVYHVSQIMKTLNSTERIKNREIIQRELQFIRVNTALLNELLTVLHEVETEEVKLMRANNEQAGNLVSSSIGKIIIFLIVFFLMAALLLFFILIDISKSNYYRNQLIKAKEEAEELGSVKQRFLSNMSHEIRTPLQSILGYSEQLKKSAGNGSQEALEAIQSSSEHLLHIVNEVLDFSRIESGKLTFQHQPFHLARCMEDVFAAIKIQAEQKELILRKDIQIQDELIVSGDAFRLKQILYNVLSNAVKFTHRGFVTLEARTTEFDYAVRCVIKISDSGIGMDEQTLNRIFNQFEQASAATGTLFGGTGLGLTIVKNLLDAQHGAIEVSSKPGEGSVFTITLNFGKATLALQKPAETLLKESSAPLRKVLIIDDDPLILRLCSIILTHQQIPHETLQDPEAALQYDRLDEVSHVFLDIRMPKINGIEICNRFRKETANRLYLIALTAHALPNEQADLLHQGFDTVLLKPFRENDFLAVIGLRPALQETVPARDLDFSVLEKMTFHDKDLQSSVMRQFADETGDDIRQLAQALGSNDVPLIREVIHKLAGRVGQMGGVSLSARLKETERLLISHAYTESLAKKVESLLHEVRQFRELILDKALQLH